MASYMIQAAYAPAAMANVIQSPQDRLRVVRGTIERLGGTLESFYLTFGEFDVMGIVNMPDDESMAAFAMAVAAGGAMRQVKTTSLLSWDEALHAMQRAGGASYTGAFPSPRFAEMNG